MRAMEKRFALTTPRAHVAIISFNACLRVRSPARSRRTGRLRSIQTELTGLTRTGRKCLPSSNFAGDSREYGGDPHRPVANTLCDSGVASRLIIFIYFGLKASLGLRIRAVINIKTVTEGKNVLDELENSNRKKKKHSYGQEH